jgi:hypothetical protein
MRVFVNYESEVAHEEFIEKGKKLINSLGTASSMSYGDRIEAAKACAMLAEACKVNGALS